MRRRLLPACVPFYMVALSSAAAAAPLTAAAIKDVQCLSLYAISVDGAKDDKARSASSMAVTYYLGRLSVEAPGIALAQSIREQMAALKTNPRASEIGAACDAEFSKLGADLVKMGQELQTRP